MALRRRPRPRRPDAPQAGGSAGQAPRPGPPAGQGLAGPGPASQGTAGQGRSQGSAAEPWLAGGQPLPSPLSAAVSVEARSWRVAGGAAPPALLAGSGGFDAALCLSGKCADCEKSCSWPLRALPPSRPPDSKHHNSGIYAGLSNLKCINCVFSIRSVSPIPQRAGSLGLPRTPKPDVLIPSDVCIPRCCRTPASAPSSAYAVRSASAAS